jgi:hypothetical protein
MELHEEVHTQYKQFFFHSINLFLFFFDRRRTIKIGDHKKCSHYEHMNDLRGYDEDVRNKLKESLIKIHRQDEQGIVHQ